LAFVAFKKVKVMGMFDSVIMDMKCPYCGEVSEIEVQTKQLECNMEVWRVGDYVTDDLNFLTCYGDCTQPECKEYSIKKRGYWSGWGRMFDVKIMLDGGRISGEYEIIEE
jgi:hypothetical protein